MPELFFKNCSGDEVALELLKWTIPRSCLWEAIIQECSQTITFLRSSHRDVFFNIAFWTCIQILWKYLWWRTIFKNLHETLSRFWPLVHHIIISSHHFAEQLFFGTPLESCFRENFKEISGTSRQLWAMGEKSCRLKTPTAVIAIIAGIF